MRFVFRHDDILLEFRWWAASLYKKANQPLEDYKGAG
jgi:hypothetical protein